MCSPTSQDVLPLACVADLLKMSSLYMELNHCSVKIDEPLDDLSPIRKTVCSNYIFLLLSKH